MSRIKIDLPKNFLFHTIIPIRITDINYGGHIGNDSILSIIHEARMQFLKNADFSELDFAGVSLIMSDVAIEFKNEAFYGENIKAFVTAQNFTRVSFDLFYKLIKEKDNDEILIAAAKTGMVCFNYEVRKVVAVPDVAKNKLFQS